MGSVMRNLAFAAVLVLSAAISPLAMGHSRASEPGRPAPLAAEPSRSLLPRLTGDPHPPDLGARIDQPLPFLGIPHTAGCGSSFPAGDSIGDLGERWFRLHVPESYDPGHPAALVLNFHGYGRTAGDQEAYSGFVPISDREGFILVTPEGSGEPQGWDIVGVYAEDGVDDTAFIADLVDHLEASLCINPGAVFALGMSNGAEMASQLACDQPEVFAAIAAVAGLLYQDCEGQPVSVIAFHGTDDWNVFYDWIPDEWQSWAAHDGCTGGETGSVTEHVTLLRATGCPEGIDVVLYTIDGGGHTWPGAPDDTGGVGYTTHEIDASELAWAFFAAHTRR